MRWMELALCRSRPLFAPVVLIILMHMAKESMSPKPLTPFERFTEAAKHIVNLPKSETDKIKAKVPYKPQKRRKPR
jgi:hypothetical protein